jgi:WhiB family redox-sensing transcriptional regulator
MTQWRGLAACENLPPEEGAYFFGDSKDGTPTHQQHERARLYCYTCPVQIQCLTWCVEMDQQYGVWGGLTESQRKRYLMPALRRGGLDDDVLGEVIWKCGARIFKRLEESEFRPPHLAPLESPTLDAPSAKSLATTNV